MTEEAEDPLQHGITLLTDRHGHKVNADPDSRDAVCNEEATRDVIFLLQKREVHLDAINGLNHGQWFSDGEQVWVDAEQFSNKDVAEAIATDNWRARDEDFDCDAVGVDDQTLIDNSWAFVTWRTESVWFRRPEAEAWAKSQRHNLGEFGKGCRVFGVCAEGRLANILKVVHSKEIEAYIHSNSFRMDYLAHRKSMDTMIGAKL